MGGVICGVRVQQGSGEWTVLAQDQCGQLKGKTLGTITIAEGTSFYVEVQYDCTNWWADCNVTFVFRYFDENGKEYDKRSYTKTVSWIGAGIWINPADGAILTPYKNGTLRIEAWEGGKLQDYVDIGIKLKEPPSEPQPVEPDYDPAEQPETPPPPPPEEAPPEEEIPPEEVPTKEEIPTVPEAVVVSAALKVAPLRPLYVAFYKDDKKIKDKVLRVPGEKLKVEVDPGTKLTFVAKKLFSLLATSVKGVAKEGEEAQVGGLTYAVELKNFLIPLK